MSKALLIIDIQNDYFEGGRFPLANAEQVLVNIKRAVSKARESAIPIVLVQHISQNEKSPFFVKGTEGVKICPSLLELVPDTPTVIKEHADSFYETNLENILTNLGVTELLICGMMTQNCITHTAISKSAEKYQVSVVGDCCATVSPTLNAIALRALTTRIAIIDVDDIK